MTMEKRSFSKEEKLAISTLPSCSMCHKVADILVEVLKFLKCETFMNTNQRIFGF